MSELYTRRRRTIRSIVKRASSALERLYDGEADSVARRRLEEASLGLRALDWQQAKLRSEIVGLAYRYGESSEPGSELAELCRNLSALAGTRLLSVDVLVEREGGDQ